MNGTIRLLERVRAALLRSKLFFFCRADPDVQWFEDHVAESDRPRAYSAGVLLFPVAVCRSRETLPLIEKLGGQNWVPAVGACAPQLIPVTLRCNWQVANRNVVAPTVLSDCNFRCDPALGAV